MRGDVIVCRDFMGDFLELVVWGNMAQTVLVHTPDQFSAHTAGSPHLEPVGFPIEDVFRKEGGTGELVTYALSRQEQDRPECSSVSNA
jgi:hypothetical protein